MWTAGLNHLRCSLVSNLKEVKAGLYGKDGHAVEKPVSQSQEREDSDSGWKLPQYRSGEEICHREDTAWGRPEAEAEEEEETNSTMAKLPQLESRYGGFLIAPAVKDLSPYWR